ncbi:MAG: hypothetical protein HGB26_03200 [Desulfobulbaceae bacterium]|nr:hypothetical protein [Desulfobulbaceae bacterium]
MNRAVSAIGFHGTSNYNYENILAAGFEQSKNPGDWLGMGVYFFQDAPIRAKKWSSSHSDPVVIGAEISLEHCMDFLDVLWWETLSEAFNELKRVCLKKGVPFPCQKNGNNKRDKMVIDLAVDALATIGVEIKSVRAIFKEGEKVFAKSALNKLDHVQIAVREEDAIRRYWKET